jgi:DNA-binding GntR family transcriptional regulator
VLDTATRQMAAALAADDLTAWAEADERFHAMLLDLCGNAKLKAVVVNFWDRAHRARMITLRMRPKPVASTREHAALVDAIRRRDPVAARELHRQHRERAGRELLGLLGQFGLHQL